MILTFGESLAGRWLGYASSTGRRYIAATACLAAVLALADSGLHAWHLKNQVQALARAAELQDSIRPPPTVQARVVVTAAEALAHNAVVRQLNIPWSMLFNCLERHADGQVALLSLEPNPARQSVRVVAEAKDVETLLRYAQALADDSLLGGLRLRQQEINETDMNRPTRLSFELRWERLSNTPFKEPS